MAPSFKNLTSKPRISASSPPFRLFDLPTEIRLRIYSYALGLRTIHIEPASWTGPPFYLPMVCSRIPKPHNYDIDEFETASAWDTGKLSLAACEYEHLAHDEDWRDDNRYWKPEARTALACNRLGWNLLLTSRQVYAEAREIPFTTNVFAFANGTALVPFCERMQAKNLFRFVRNMVFVMPSLRDTVEGYGEEWHEEFEALYASALPGLDGAMFPGLRNLQLVVRSEGGRFPGGDVDAWMHKRWIWGFGFLAHERIADIRLSVDSSGVRLWNSNRAPVGDVVSGTTTTTKAALMQYAPSKDAQRRYEEAVREWLASGWDVVGPQTEELKREYQDAVKDLRDGVRRKRPEDMWPEAAKWAPEGAGGDSIFAREGDKKIAARRRFVRWGGGDKRWLTSHYLDLQEAARSRR